MSVPPPSCVPKSRSTGSCRSSVRSTTDGIEDHHARADRSDRGQHRAEDAGIDHRRRHRAALVHAEDDVAQRRAFVAVADQLLGDDRATLGQIVLQVGADGAVPVDLVGARTMCAWRGSGCRAPPGSSDWPACAPALPPPCAPPARAVSLVFSGMTLLSESRLATRCTSARRSPASPAPAAFASG